MSSKQLVGGLGLRLWTLPVRQSILPVSWQTSQLFVRGQSTSLNKGTHSVVKLSTHTVLKPQNSRHLSMQQNKDADQGRLVYEGTISRTVKGVKAFSLFTSCLGVGVQPWVWTQVGSEIQNKILVVSVFGFSILCMPLLLHFVTKKYVTKLYWDEPGRKFTAETISLFLRRKSLTFSVDEAEMAEMSGIFTSFKAKGQAFFVDGSTFLDREAYIALMGLDKPFEWEEQSK